MTLPSATRDDTIAYTPCLQMQSVCHAALSILLSCTFFFFS